MQAIILLQLEVDLPKFGFTEDEMKTKLRNYVADLVGHALYRSDEETPNFSGAIKLISSAVHKSDNRIRINDPSRN